MTDVIPPEVTDRDVYITRSFNAPIATVWKFWTEPERLAEWFGPVGIHTPLAKIDVDLKDGGHWNLVMTDDATGDEFPMSATIVTDAQARVPRDGRLGRDLRWRYRSHLPADPTS